MMLASQTIIAIISFILSKSQLIVKNASVIFLLAVQNPAFAGEKGVLVGTVPPACGAPEFARSQRLVVVAVGTGIIKPIKGAKVFTVAVKQGWWLANGKPDQLAMIAQISCAVAGQGKRLGQLRMISQGTGALLYQHN